MGRGAREMASLVERQAEELRVFEEEAADLRKKATGKKKKQVNFDLEQRLADMQYRHRLELDEADGEGATDEEETGTADPPEEPRGPTAAEVAAARKAKEDADAEKRRAKAAKKRDKKAAKASAEREKDWRIASETAALEASSERKFELEAIDRKLAAERLRVFEVAADGHCLYRSVADQLGDGSDFAELRRTCADHMASHRDDFVAFVALDADDPNAAFDDHVRKIRDTAEWGGQPELLALARALRRPIRVHARDAPLLEMGAEFDGAPLVVAYHRHYYALGEHYNSTEAADS